VTKARSSFWLDGGYDFETVRACRHHPGHAWVTLRLGDVLANPSRPDELITICRACYVPRCGSTADPDRCTLWRHHETAHVFESGRRLAVGGLGVPV
jgi:hypothetical protein